LKIVLSGLYLFFYPTLKANFVISSQDNLRGLELLKRVRKGIGKNKGRKKNMTQGSLNFYYKIHTNGVYFVDLDSSKAVLQIRIRMFLDLPDPGPLVRGTDPALDTTIIKQRK
jgi:hypothetical protein